MNDLIELKLSASRIPVEKTIEIDGKEYQAYFLPLTRREFTALLKKDDADDHFIAASWCDAQGNLRLQSAEQAGDFPPPAYNKLISAVLEACGMGKQAIDDAKKD